MKRSHKAQNDTATINRCSRLKSATLTATLQLGRLLADDATSRRWSLIVDRRHRAPPPAAAAAAHVWLESRSRHRLHQWRHRRRHWRRHCCRCRQVLVAGQVTCHRYTCTRVHTCTHYTHATVPTHPLFHDFRIQRPLQGPTLVQQLSQSAASNAPAVVVIGRRPYMS